MQRLEDFLADPRSFGLLAEACGLKAGARVELIETHAAQIFLCGEVAVKIKRAVRYSFLDFSTLDKRKSALQRELEINSRGAADLYLGLVPIVQSSDGDLGFSPSEDGLADGPGSPDLTADAVLEWGLVMRCFDNQQRLDRLCERGDLDSTCLRQIVDQVHSYHDSAEVRGAPYGGGAALEKIIQQNARDFAQCPGLFKEQRIEALLSSQRQALAAVQTQLDLRRDSGWVRRGHGDLHLANLVVWQGRPILFDAIEFDEEIGTEDLLYDLSFLLMDLVYRGQRVLANQALNRFMGRRGGYEGLAALPLMLSLRAAIRAKVGGLTGLRLREEKQIPDLVEAEESKGLSYLQLAEDFLTVSPAGLGEQETPLLLAIGGLSGSGKSTLAQAVAPDLSSTKAVTVGAIHLRSDMIRKRLMGVEPEVPLGPDAYTPEVSHRVYQTLFSEAREALAAGYPVIADAVWARPGERAALEEIARQAGVPFTGIWLEAPQEELLSRVSARRDDVSDAGPDVVRQQADYDLGEITWEKVDSRDRRLLLQVTRQHLQQALNQEVSNRSEPL
ncbi:AAA family ATPase [Rhodovibrionaceae bacterium A322]